MDTTAIKKDSLGRKTKNERSKIYNKIGKEKMVERKLNYIL